MEWTRKDDEFEGRIYTEWRLTTPAGNRAHVHEIFKVATNASVSTGLVYLGMCSKDERDILRTIRVPIDQGEDPCATARAKAEEFIKLFNL